MLSRFAGDCCIAFPIPISIKKNNFRRKYLKPQPLKGPEWTEGPYVNKNKHFWEPFTEVIQKDRSLWQEPYDL